MIAAMATIEELLHRRTDLSTFLVHFTRDSDDESASASDNLLNILMTRRIEARSALGMAKDLADRFEEVADTQRVVCFTETPLEHAWMMCSQIQGRSIRFDGYGIAFTKAWARRRGVNPVWYLDITPGHDWLTGPITELVAEAVKQATPPRSKDPEGYLLAERPILRLTPFVEQMGPTRERRKEFWWEREWRRVGDLVFATDDIVVVFAPEDEHEDLKNRLRSEGRNVPAMVDATWGLERMIASLTQVSEVGPFPS